MCEKEFCIAYLLYPVVQSFDIIPSVNLFCLKGRARPWLSNLIYLLGGYLEAVQLLHPITNVFPSPSTGK